MMQAIVARVVPRVMLSTTMRCAAIFVCTAALLSAARFDIDSTGRIVRLADPQISPDGRKVAVLVSRANFEENRFDADLVLIDTATKARRTLTNRRGVTQPRWSAQGDRLAFLAPVEGKLQIHVLPMEGGEAVPLTKAPTGVQQYTWSPDGVQIAFISADEPEKRTGPERHNRSFEAADNDFLVTALPMPAHAWLIPSAGGTARRLTSGAWTLPITLPPSSPSSPLSWSPDGKSLVLVKTASPYTGDAEERSVQILDIASGALRPLTGRSRSESQPLISPDGRSVAYWYPREGQNRNVNEIYVSPIAGGEGRSITRTIDRNIQRSIWMPDSQSLLVSANDGTTTGVWIQPVDGPARRLNLGNVVPAAAFWLDASTSASGQIVFTASEPRRPSEIYFLDSPSSPPVRLTAYNDETAALELGATETVRWTGPDGFAMDGVLTFPPDFAQTRKYPLVFYIHGGPRSASKEAFSARAQLLASQGWIVFEPNYRGSDNLGNTFQAAIWNDSGSGPGRDVMSGLDLLKDRGYVDESRIATTGWSYGGYMTTWLLGNYPQVWKAAVAGAAVTDWMDQYTIGDANVRRGESFGGSPFTDPNRMRAFIEQSPITYASRIKAPTLVLCLTGDYRVPITQSYKLYHALRDNNVPTKFVAYPLTGHSPTDPVHSRDVDRRWLDWLNTYLR
jgi:dipeptidyl aminopeptidase/acylaminoacyl peptidase